MKTIARIFFLMTLFLAGSAAAQGWVVSPGDGVGALTVGMTRAAADTLLTPTEDIGQFVRYGDELLIEYSGNSAVMISLHQKTFKTRSGVVSWVPYKGAGIGVPWNSVVNQLPAGKITQKLKTAKGYPDEYYHAYTNIGLGFRVKGGAIVQVDIWAKK